MKNLLFILFLLFVGYGFTQNIEKTDTNEICIPVPVARQILLDLNELDRLTNEKKITESEINELESKIKLQNGVIVFLEEKDSIGGVVLKKTEEKVTLLEEANKELRTDIIKLKVRHTIFELISAAIVGGLTYVIIFK
jgi:hypothetical protein